MTEHKNLQNVVDRLEVEGVNAHNAQQLNRDIMDRKHESQIEHDSRTNKKTDLKNSERRPH